MISDSAYILDILEQFFKDKEIKKKFQIIQNSNITGWEIWLRIRIFFKWIRRFTRMV
jgi:hypothetical protein